MNLKGGRNSPSTGKDRISTIAGQIQGFGQENWADADRTGTATEPANEHIRHITSPTTEMDLKAVVDAEPYLPETVRQEICSLFKKENLILSESPLTHL